MSANPETRLQAHNAGKVRSTKSRKPYKFILIEKFPDRQTARSREKYYKTGFGRKVWKKKITD